jgi:hypothetical protein
MMKMTTCALLALLWLLAATLPAAEAQETGFTQADRERLVRMEATLQVFMEQTDKRFEQVDKRFEQVTTFLWMLVGIFTTMTVTTIGFAFWDRRTMINRARDETIQIIEKDGRLCHLIQALRQLAPEDPKLANVLRSHGLL